MSNLFHNNIKVLLRLFILFICIMISLQQYIYIYIYLFSLIRSWILKLVIDLNKWLRFT